MLPRVTLASVLSPGSFPRRPANGAALGSNSSKGSNKSRRQLGHESEPKSVLSRLLSKCTVKEPTYDEVTVAGTCGGRGAVVRRIVVAMLVFECSCAPCR